MFAGGEAMLDGIPAVPPFGGSSESFITEDYPEGNCARLGGRSVGEQIRQVSTSLSLSGLPVQGMLKRGEQVET